MSAAPSLFDPDLKCQWAKKHLDSLAAEFLIFKQTNKHEISTEEDTENRLYIVRIKHPPIERSLQVVLTAGDFISCLRSSLDHLAWQLTLLGGVWPSREICFPICERNTLEAQLKIVKSTYGMPDSAVSILKSLQPYQYGENFKSSPLWLLNMLWNIDKHRHISAFTILPNWQFKAEGGIEISPEQIDDCTIFSFPITHKEKIDFNPDRTVDLRFYDKREGIEIGYDDFAKMYEYVTETVLPSFAKFFS
jgi:hypothetical protein